MVTVDPISTGVLVGVSVRPAGPTVGVPEAAVVGALAVGVPDDGGDAEGEPPQPASVSSATRPRNATRVLMDGKVDLRRPRAVDISETS